MNRRLASLRWLQLGAVRQLLRYYQDAMTPCCRPAALRFLRLAVPLRSLVVFAPWRTSEPPRPGVGNPVSPAGNSPRSEQGSPKFLGNLNYPFANVPIRRRQDCSHQTIAMQQRGPWSSKGKGSHDWVFRRSIALLSDSLSTLRNADYSNTTQDSLPVAGQALLDGISTRKIPLKGFKSVIYISFPFPKLCLAQSMQPPRAGDRDCGGCQGSIQHPPLLPDVLMIVEFVVVPAARS